MRQYLNLLQEIKTNGDGWRKTRNAETKALFAKQLRFHMNDGFPAMTTKKLFFELVKAELLWFLEGSTDNRRLKEIAEQDVKIWDGDAQQHFDKGKAKFLGDLGPVYGKQWRSWRAPDGRKIDQLRDVIDRIKKNPFDRRLIVSAWNPGDIEYMALPPCHLMFQFFVSTDGKLSLSMRQRSCDMFLGVPFNIASYALLLHMVAHVTKLTPGECVLDLIDAHIYKEHLGAVNTQLAREPLPLPRLWLNPDIHDIDAFTMKNIRLEDYNFHPHIKAPLLTQDIKK
ncbi:MAG: thymidylate synthase [Parcubacteria group bacterium]|nr:thymidylate synthase [Parcubacteria group bacterium]